MPKLKEDYILANCCTPDENDQVIGYYSHNNIIKVHKAGCHNLDKADSTRLVALEWRDIIAGDEFRPDKDYHELDDLDWIVLQHHKTYGVDYSLKVAAMLHIDKQAVFDSHKKLRGMKLLERVKPLMMQYRKGIVDNKWIKHRNHTYYNLTDKGRDYLAYHQKSS